jgi:hypothetical protein
MNVWEGEGREISDSFLIIENQPTPFLNFLIYSDDGRT